MSKRDELFRGIPGHGESPEGTEGTNGVGPVSRRWMASRKLDAVMCVLRGQSLDAVSPAWRQTGGSTVSASMI